MKLRIIDPVSLIIIAIAVAVIVSNNECKQYKVDNQMLEEVGK